MSNQLVPQDPNTVIESVVIGGDLSKLSAADRVNYYKSVCASVGLNPLTRPFDYITLNGKLTLYARKDATDQLRKINNVSIGKPDIQFEGDWIIVTVVAEDKTGRTDSDVGVVNKKDMRGDFGNALMKAVTKAKRRVTLSICGLGFLDETEIETIPEAKKVFVDESTGEIHEIGKVYLREVEMHPTTDAPPPEPEPVKTTKTNGKPRTHFHPQDLVDAGVSPDIADAAGVAMKLHLSSKNTIEDAVKLGKAYRAERDGGLSPDEAAAKVLAG